VAFDPRGGVYGTIGSGVKDTTIQIPRYCTFSLSRSLNEPGCVLILARYIEGGPGHQNASKYQGARIPGRLIQAADSMDSFFRFTKLALSTSASPFHPLLAFPFPPSKSCLSFIPIAISISSLAVAVKGLDENGLTWFSRHQF
jgi:hypothetical protein